MKTQRYCVGRWRNELAVVLLCGRSPVVFAWDKLEVWPRAEGDAWLEDNIIVLKACDDCMEHISTKSKQYQMFALANMNLSL